MSKQDLIKVVQRSINDAAFRRQLTNDTANALRGYSLTPDEISALRSRDAGKLTAFGVDTRMSKVFTIDQGALGNATITSGGEPRDTAPVWVGDGAAHGSVQTPDAAARNAAFTSESSARGAVQSPDAMERNAAIIGDPTLAATGAVQSPDAIDRNLAYAAGGGSSVRDSEPVNIGDTAAPTNAAPIDGSPEASFNAATTGGMGVRDSEPVWVGDLGQATGAVQSPDAMDRNALITGGGAEPRDTEPTWIGDNDGTTSEHTYSGDDAAGPEHTTGDGDLQQ